MIWIVKRRILHATSSHASFLAYDEVAFFSCSSSVHIVDIGSTSSSYKLALTARLGSSINRRGQETMRVTQQEKKRTRNGTRTSKVLKILLEIIGAILIAIVLLLAIVYTVNTISTHSEQKRVEPYGQHVAVDGKKRMF